MRLPQCRLVSARLTILKGSLLPIKVTTSSLTQVPTLPNTTCTTGRVPNGSVAYEIDENFLILCLRGLNARDT
jgi:hypothetical protein